MTTLTVGTNDAADNTGDLIVTFVDVTPAGSLTTDGSRTALPNVTAAVPAINITDNGGSGVQATVLAGSGGSITDASNNIWTIDPGNGGQVFENGALPNGQFSSNVAQIVMAANVIYHENTSIQWYSWSGTAWVPTTDPTAGPAGSWMNHYAFGGNEFTLPFNNELQYYGSSSRTPGFNPFSMANGILSITANSVANTVTNPLSLPYNSGAMVTATEPSGVPGQGLFSFTIGYVAARMLLPKGQGLWPAFWLMPQPFPTTGVEIDIMEALGRDVTTVFCTTHQSGGTQTPVTVSDYSVNYHEYAIDVQADFLTWYIDGVKVKQFPSDSTVTELKYVLMNLAIASANSWDGSPGVGPPNASTPLPASMQVSFIRTAASRAAYVAGMFNNLLPAATSVVAPTVGTYLIAPSISPLPGCAVTFSPTTAQWESCSLIWQPPPHAAVLWTSGGMFAGAGGAAANPKFPPQSFTGAGETDAAAGLSGSAVTRAALGGSVGAAAGISGRAIVRGASGAMVAGAGGVASNFAIQHPGGTSWFLSGAISGAAAISSRSFVRDRLSAEIDAAAGISGDATRLPAFNPQSYLVSGSINAAAGIISNPWIGHQYFVAAQPAAAGGVIPFGGNAPLRVTNYVRNPRPEMNQGTSTLPVEWFSFDASNELTMTIIGEGTESGIPYLDFQFSVGAGAGGETYFQTEQFVMTGPGSVWSYSQFLRLVGGSLTNITKVALFMFSGDSATGAGITPHIGSAITPTSAALSSQSSSFSTLINDTGMDSFATGYYLLHAAGAVNLTLRVGGAKAEKLAASTGSQFLAVPQVGFVPSLGGTTSFVY